MLCWLDVFLGRISIIDVLDPSDGDRVLSRRCTVIHFVSRERKATVGIYASEWPRRGGIRIAYWMENDERVGSRFAVIHDLPRHRENRSSTVVRTCTAIDKYNRD